MASSRKNTAQLEKTFCTLGVDLEQSLVTELRREAAARDTSVDALVRALFDAIAKDRLVGAILDDGR